MNNKVKELLNSNDLSAIIKRISHEILESTSSLENIAIIGIKSRGDHIAKRIVKHIQEVNLLRKDLRNLWNPWRNGLEILMNNRFLN